MEWVFCLEGDDGQDPVYPSTPGHYRVLIAGDSESIDGHEIYSFEDYETWGFFGVKDKDGYVPFIGSHDEEIETVVAWCGPYKVPPLP